jgi:hypothetical protein
VWKLCHWRSLQNCTSFLMNSNSIADAQSCEVEVITIPYPTKMGSQNEFSSPPTPFETHGRNVTVFPADIFCYHSQYFLCYWNAVCPLHSINAQTTVLNTHEQTNSYLIIVTWQKLLLRVTQQMKECFLWSCRLMHCCNKYAPTPSRLYRWNLSSIYNCDI